MAEAAQKDSFFLSYSRSDQPFALKLARDLREQGVNMWVDQFDIRPSEHWDRAIERAVRECRGIVVVLSPRSVVSDNVADEISFAIDSGKSVLPVMIERCTLPLRITRMQVIDATGNYATALEQCLAELRRGDGPGAIDPPSRVARHEPIDPAAIDAVKRQLTRIIGPVAGVLVDKEGVRANSADELYQLLSGHIHDEGAREEFLAALRAKTHARPKFEAKPLPARESVPPADLDAMAKLLTRYVGPIAPRLAKREGASCGSAEELRERLASFIPAESERAAFLRECQSR